MDNLKLIDILNESFDSELFTAKNWANPIFNEDSPNYEIHAWILGRMSQYSYFPIFQEFCR